jgi:hypothetical protein
MKYLQINADHYVNVDAIEEIEVKGRETECEVLIRMRSAYSAPLIWRRFHAKESSATSAIQQAEFAIRELIRALSQDDS